MTASPAQTAANRANSQKSTGPNTPEGKQRSRANALKHGLTGDGVALRDEDAAAVADRFHALRAELNPAGALGLLMVGRVTLLMVRLDRCARHETAFLDDRIDSAAERFDDDRATYVEDLFGGMPVEPARHVRLLRTSHEGIDLLLAAWRGLADDLNDPATPWTDAHTALAENLTGRRTGSVPVPPARKLGDALGLGLITDRNDPASDREALRARDAARGQLAALIAAEVASLRAAREALDPHAVARARARAADLALFDLSKEAILVRRYEAAAERGLYRALRELRESEAALAASGNLAATQPIVTPCNELASFRPAPPEPPPVPEPAPVAVDLPVRKANGSAHKASQPARPSDPRPVSVVRTPSRERNEFSDLVTAAFAG